MSEYILPLLQCSFVVDYDSFSCHWTWSSFWILCSKM